MGEGERGRIQGTASGEGKTSIGITTVVHSFTLIKIVGSSWTLSAFNLVYFPLYKSTCLFPVTVNVKVLFRPCGLMFVKT